jgi:chromosome segregation ATPase
MKKFHFLLALLPLALAACDFNQADRLQAVHDMEGATTRYSQLQSVIDNTERTLERLGTEIKILREDIKVHGEAYEKSRSAYYRDQVLALTDKEVELNQRIASLEAKRNQASLLVSQHRDRVHTLQARLESLGCNLPGCVDSTR